MRKHLRDALSEIEMYKRAVSPPFCATRFRLTHSGRFGIRSVPSLIAFRGGKPIGQLVGYAPRQAIDKLLG